MSAYPKNYLKLKELFPELIRTYEDAGSLAKQSGPLDAKTGHLIQLAACAALRAEGGVHSHAKRALEAGASGSRDVRQRPPARGAARCRGGQSRSTNPVAFQNLVIAFRSFVKKLAPEIFNVFGVSGAPE